MYAVIEFKDRNAALEALKLTGTELRTANGESTIIVELKKEKASDRAVIHRMSSDEESVRHYKKDAEPIKQKRSRSPREERKRDEDYEKGSYSTRRRSREKQYKSRRYDSRDRQSSYDSPRYRSQDRYSNYSSNR